VSRPVGIVGVGYRGRKHLKDLAALRPDAPVVVYDRDPLSCKRAVHERPDATVCESLDRLLAAEPAMVIVATTPDAHLESSQAAIDAGADVFCEKPWGLDGEQTAAIVHAAARAGRRLGYGLDLRALPAVRAAREAVASGAVGRVVDVSARWTRAWLFPTTRQPEDFPTWITERRRAGGGVLRDTGVHAVDLVLNAVGYPREPLSLHATFSYALGSAAVPEVERLIGGPAVIDTEDGFDMIGRLGGDIRLSVISSWFNQVHPGERVALEVHGTEGSVWVAGNHGKVGLRAWARDSGPAAKPHRLDLDAWAQAARTPLAAFLETLDRDAEPLVPDRELLALSRVVGAIRASADSGLAVELEPDAERVA
jgi:predicted dehydrogenase